MNMEFLPSTMHITNSIQIDRALGSAFPLYDLQGFIAGQTPTIPEPATLHPSSVALAYQLGNLYSLLFLVGVGVCHATTEPKVLRNYLVGLAIADVGHVYATGLAMGWDAFLDVGSWNALTWGNIGATAFLFVNRIAYFWGVFGYAKAPKAAEKQQ
ncbi:unnamed protein product [Penicillium salamii]|uniref:DUF7704 domain-containing protein n=1 Tax=Penicillium salamii TaxID=1612424 RepID=A0A9W4I9X7_9EURO|nr:unnamed protein product [Penicillium salamii]CAG8234642.1 unnamed protein product [Penicillium salamii]CAG8253430.1 unnamed protein product [Penicillium salamii]CAG8263112.1 unnamed protein product [Penicillium salamii]CAG8349966.1 unnamed protein product [Penicillium salamii]